MGAAASQNYYQTAVAKQEDCCDRLGDPAARAQSAIAAYPHALETEVAHLLVHGILHPALSRALHEARVPVGSLVRGPSGSVQGAEGVRDEARRAAV